MQQQNPSWIGEYDVYLSRDRTPHLVLQLEGRGQESIPPSKQSWKLLWTEEEPNQIRISYPGRDWGFLIRFVDGQYKAYETDGTPLGPVKKIR